MLDLFGLALLATLAWILALMYYNRCHPLKEQYKNKVGFKSMCGIILQFAVMIFLFRFLSEPAGRNSTLSNTGVVIGSLTVLQWSMIFLLGILLWIALSKEISETSDYLFKNDRVTGDVVKNLFLVILVILMLFKILTPFYILHNILLFVVVTVVLVFAVSLTRGGLITFFAAIMLLDIYLVWVANSAPGDSSKTSWYVSMIQSPFMQHFPFPLGFRWGNRLLGNGDIFFMCLTVMYARRVWSNTAAVVAGILVTLPIVLLPLASYILASPPPAWPYTIFISPVALFIAICRRAD